MSTVLLDDFAGHAFMLDLAEAFKRVGHDVTYQYSATNLSPHADFESADVPVLPISTPRPFEKYNIRRRVMSEVSYGWRSALTIRTQRPDVAILNNLPLLSLVAPLLFGRLTRSLRVVWQQDMQSGLVAGAAGKHRFVASLARLVERFVLRRADAVVVISEDLAGSVRELGVRPDRVHVIENWAPVEQIPVLDRDNEWSRRHDLGDRVRFVYSGTLALKHSPGVLVDLAVADAERDVIVVSEGVGAEWLAREAATKGVENLHVLPFQPYEDLPKVLAAGDVLILLLTDEAGRHSVPSKALSYLCSGRPVLASIPAGNEAARMVSERAQAGVVVRPDDPEGLLQEAKRLARDPQARVAYGESGRRYAEATFSSIRVAERLGGIVSALSHA